MFDLYIYPFGYQSNEEYSNLTGFFVGNVLRKATRTRAEDIIIFRFTSMRHLVPDEMKTIDEMVNSSCEFFYKTKGPITTAAKKAVDYFNEKLSNFNSKAPSKKVILGTIHFLILNKDNLYVLHAGGATTFLLSKNKIEKFEDRSHGMEGIGVSKTVRTNFYHSKLGLNDRILITTKPPLTWTKEALFDNQRLTISYLRRTLIRISENGFEAVIVQIRNGTGNVHQLKLDSTINTANLDEEKNSKEIIDEQKSSLSFSDDEEVIQEINQMEFVEKFDFKDFPKETNIQQPLPDFLVQDFNDDNNLHEIEVDEPINDDINPSEKFEDQGFYLSGEKVDLPSNSESISTPKSDHKKERNKTFAILLLRTRLLFQKINARIEETKSKSKSMLIKGVRSTKISSTLENDQLSSSSMLMIAILVAIIVSAIGITVYFQSGVGSQQRELIANANLLVSDALSETVQSNKILLYEEALRLVIESEDYGKSQDITEFKVFIQKELDSLKGINRIPVQVTILGGLDRRISISRMVINNSGDLFALDSGTGRVIRMIATRSDYVVDTSFVCGPGRHNDVVVDSLIDIEVVNFANNLNTSVMGIDGRGNLILCRPGDNPVGIQLKRADLNWGEIKALAFNGFSLYVLDTGEISRDIYRYPVSDYAFDQIPESIFSTNIPENLSEVIDISVNQEELFFVHTNGELTRCNLLGGRSSSSCEKNIGYGVIVDGVSRENVDNITGSQFSQIYLTLPPDPSIYFMDNMSGSIYHFSMALNLQQQIKPNMSNVPMYTEEKPLTAFAVSPNGIIQFAYENLIYYGYLP